MRHHKNGHVILETTKGRLLDPLFFVLSNVVLLVFDRGGANIFADIPPDAFKNHRKRIIELILATDMALHFDSVSRFRLRRQAAGFSYLTDVEDMWYDPSFSYCCSYDRRIYD